MWLPWDLWVQKVRWGQWSLVSQGICWDGTTLQTLGMGEGVQREKPLRLPRPVLSLGRPL